MYGSTSSRLVLVAGMVMTAAITRTAHQRARADRKQATASSQQAAKVAKRVARYHRNADQSVDRCAMRALAAMMGANSDSRSCERKNSVA